MFTLDFSGRSNAFAHGFLKGLAAPAMLFHNEDSPIPPHFAEIIPPNYPIAEALAGDWVRIGQDMAKVINEHGEAPVQAPK